MNTPRVVLSLISLVIVLVIVQSTALRLTKDQPETLNTADKYGVRQEVQSLQITPSPVTYGAAGPTAMPISPTPVPSMTPIQSGLTAQASTVILNNFIYGNSTIVEQDDTHVILQTLEPVHVVFQWYEKKLVEQNARQKATVKTEVNNDFLSKISATVSGNVIDIVIEKKSGVTITTITLAIRPS